MRRIFLVFLIVLGSASLCFSADYLPKHKEGIVKVFKIINKNIYGSESNSNSAKALAPRKIAGKKVNPWVWQNGFIGYELRDKIGTCGFAKQSPSDVEPQIDDDPFYNLKYPLKPGTNWQHKGKTYLLQKKIDVTCKRTIESTDDNVTVPAGTFKNCLRVKSYGKRVLQKKNPYIQSVFVPKEGFWVTIESYSWYAQKIGWIKSIIKHDSNHSHVGPAAERIYLLTEYKKP